MTFALVNPGMWSSGDKLGAGQMNTLQGYVADALDKVGGDTATGTITFAYVGAGYGVNLACTSEITGVLNVNPGGSIYVGQVGGIEVAVARGLLLDGSANWPAFTATQTRSIAFSLVTAPPLSGGVEYFAASAARVGGLAPSMRSIVLNGSFSCPVAVHNGATLTSVTIWFVLTFGRAGLPFTFPSIQMFRETVSLPSSTTPMTSMCSTGPAYAASGSLGAYESGNPIAIALTVDTANVIDTTLYTYYLNVVDETNTNAMVGNSYYSAIAHYTGISDMRFP